MSWENADLNRVPNLLKISLFQILAYLARVHYSAVADDGKAVADRSTISNVGAQKDCGMQGFEES